MFWLFALVFPNKPPVKVGPLATGCTLPNNPDPPDGRFEESDEFYGGVYFDFYEACSPPIFCPNMPNPPLGFFY